MASIQKAIIPMAGLGTRFLPLSRVIPKAFFPLGDKPLLHYILQEVKNSGIRKCIFVVRKGERYVQEYFRRESNLEKLLQSKKRDHLVAELKEIQRLKEEFSFSFTTQNVPSGDAHAVFLAMRQNAKEPSAVLFPDDIILSKIPCVAQLTSTFRTTHKPIIALRRISREQTSHYGVIQGERIAKRLYRIKKIVEKPIPTEAPSDLAIIGRYLLTPEVFEYLKKFEKLHCERSKTHIHLNSVPFRGVSAEGYGIKEFILADVLNAMVRDGKVIYGYEVEGEWLECGTKEGWMKANLSFLLRHSSQQKELRQYLKNFL